jgi:hypothetical protein
MEGDFVVFLIGMRINNPVMVHRWVPVARAMLRMLKELRQRKELGFMHSEMWLSRTILLVQYWRSLEQLLAYARNKDAEHLSAWRAFNERAATDGSVGIWHETYVISPGNYENVYVNMPPFGLAKAGNVQPATGRRQTAVDRLHVHHERKASH